MPSQLYTLIGLYETVSYVAVSRCIYMIDSKGSFLARRMLLLALVVLQLCNASGVAGSGSVTNV
jgi:hypothetical protein